jgi:hypothetical protein
MAIKIIWPFFGFRNGRFSADFQRLRIAVAHGQWLQAVISLP